MPPPRRRPAPVPSPTPNRRPRVAGLRHPDAPHDQPDNGEVESRQGSLTADAPADRRATDRRATDQRSSDQRSSDQRSSDQRGSDQRTSGQRSSEQRGSARRVSTAPANGRQTRPERDTETTAVLAEPISDLPSPDLGHDSDRTTTRRTSRRTTARRAEAAVPEPAADSAVAAAGPTRSPLLVPIVLGVVAVLLGGAAVFFGLQWSNLSGTVGSNTALTDNAGTSEVKGQVTSAINTTFSYNYTDVNKTEKAAQNLLTGNALCQYNALFKVIQQQAPGQKLVLTTTVTNSGVQTLQGNQAQVLLVVDQKDTRVSTNQPVESQAALVVNALKQGNSWKISNIDTFSGQNADAKC